MNRLLDNGRGGVLVLRLYAVSCRKPQPARGTRRGQPSTGLPPPRSVTRHAAARPDAMEKYEYCMMKANTRSFDSECSSVEYCLTGDNRGCSHTLRQRDSIVVKKLAEVES